MTDEIRKLCEEIIPRLNSCENCCCNCQGHFKVEVKQNLTKALESGKLVKPLSVDEIQGIMFVERSVAFSKGANPTAYTIDADIAKAIHEAQFRKGE